jgi:hypothetical protein
MPDKPWDQLTEKERRVEIATKTPRKLLAERMYHAVIRELLPDGRDQGVEQIFEDTDQHTALLAISDMAGSLIADTASIEGNDTNWETLVGVVADQMRRCGACEEPDLPTPRQQ